MSLKSMKLRNLLPQSPPPRSASSPQKILAKKSEDTVVLQAEANEKKGKDWKKLALLVGMVTTTAVGCTQSGGTEQTVVQISDQGILDTSVSPLDLSYDTSGTQTDQSFVAGAFNRQETLESLEHFDSVGRLYDDDLFFDDELTPKKAQERFGGHDFQDVYVETSDGRSYKINNERELQELDTFLGQSTKPVIDPYLVETLQSLSSGGELDAGLYDGKGKELNAYDAYRELWREKPKTVEVRQGLYRGLKVNNPGSLAETRQWLESRADKPFTQEQQRDAANYLNQEYGFLVRNKPVTATEALERLQDGKSVDVPSEKNGNDSISNIQQLQILDSVRGTGANRLIPEEAADSLVALAEGFQSGDGLYKSDKLKDSLSAFEAANRVFWQRNPLTVATRGEHYKVESLVDLQELNSLQGDRKNTILPEAEFESLQLFSNVDVLHLKGNGEHAGTSVDAYEALQVIQAGEAVQVPSRERLVTLDSTDDFRELRALEFTQENDILDSSEYDLLKFWEGNGTYRVDQDDQEDFAYEALQAIQGGEEFEVESAGRFAPASDFLDLQNLASFEAPEAGFPSLVSAEDMERLQHFESVNEVAKEPVTRVSNREGRAYEGHRELRQGQDFQVWSGERWNTIADSQSLHDLDALLGRQINDILPQDQYDLLKHLGDQSPKESFFTGNESLNSHGALQRFRAGEPVTYNFVGGDFAEELKIETPGLESLERTKQLRDNQKEFDLYAYPVGEWQTKMERQSRRTPDLADSALSRAESKLDSAEDRLDSAESREESAKDRKEDAEDDLKEAKEDHLEATRMPSYVDETQESCDYNGCTESVVSVRNESRDKAVRRADERIDRAEGRISKAKTDISNAQNDKAKAGRDIRSARGAINETRFILDNFSDYELDLSTTDLENLDQRLVSLKTQLEEMDTRTHSESLEKNIDRQQKLIENMVTRPARPDGWEIPSELVQS